MERLRAVSGFSLVELLVSMVLLAIIVLLSSYSYAQFVRYWDGRLGNFDATFEALRDEWLLTDTLNSIQPYVVKNNQNIPRFYFEGNINGFVAVSNKSIASVSVASVVRIGLSQRDDLKFDLTYEEAPMSRSALTRLTEQPIFSPPVVLLSGLTEPKFSYFGVEARDQNGDSEFESPRAWSQTYNSAATLAHPQKIKFSWSIDGTVESSTFTLVQPKGGELDFLKPEGFDL